MKETSNIGTITLIAAAEVFSAFSAFANEDRSYLTGDTIQFGEVRTNYGGDFVPGSEYVCPVSGYYLFTVVFLRPAGSTSDITTSVVVNEEVVAGIRGTSAAHAGRETTTNSVVMFCGAGQRAMVRANGSFALNLGGAFALNSFSGMFLYSTAQ